MKSEILSLPGYRVCEYLLVLHPHPDLVERIIKVKEKFAEKYKLDSARWGKPYIALVKFSQLQMMEERLMNRIKMIAMSLPAIKIELKDFGSFPTHTIYINVESKTTVQQLVKQIKPAQSLMRTQDKKAHFLDNPHMAIARGLSPTQYEEAWLEYSHTHFTGKFIANSLLLLRRPEGTKAYHTIQSFDFMNMPVVTAQGSLF